MHWVGSMKRGRVLVVDRLTEYDDAEESAGGMFKRMTQATEAAKLLNCQAGYGVSDGFRISSDPQASQEDQALGDAEE